MIPSLATQDIELHRHALPINSSACLVKFTYMHYYSAINDFQSHDKYICSDLA